MIEANIDLGPMLDKLADTAFALGARKLAPVLELSVADHYAAQPVPVDTGRLKRALTTKPRAAERKTVVLGTMIEVQIRVPYARYQLRRLAPYRPADLGGKIASHLLAILQGRISVQGQAPSAPSASGSLGIAGVG